MATRDLSAQSCTRGSARDSQRSRGGFAVVVDEDQHCGAGVPLSQAAKIDIGRMMEAPGRPRGGPRMMGHSEIAD